jgi:hypothetical protein
MVASTPEYHILGKRVAVDRFRLGTIINNIQECRRLNAGAEPEIEDKRLDYWHDTEFQATREEALNGDVGIELKVAALEGVGGEAGVEGERGNTDQYGFDALDTLEFESEKKDYESSAKAEGVQTFLSNTGCLPVFFITGIKVGRIPSNGGSSFDYTKVKRLGGSLSFGVNVPSVASVGPKANLSTTLTTTQKGKEHSDRIFAIRVRKLQYKKGGLFGPRKWVDMPHNDGAEMVSEGRAKKVEEKIETIYGDAEEVEVDEEELEGYRKVTETNKRGEQITYVVPEDW